MTISKLENNILKDIVFPENPDTVLAILCGDPTWPLAKVAEKIIGHKKITFYAPPGGLGQVMDVEARKIHINNLKIFSKKTDWKKAIAIGHAGCGFYQGKYNKLSPANLITKIITDLQQLQIFINFYDEFYGISKFDSYYVSRQSIDKIDQLRNAELSYR